MIGLLYSGPIFFILMGVVIGSKVRRGSRAAMMGWMWLVLLIFLMKPAVSEGKFEAEAASINWGDFALGPVSINLAPSDRDEFSRLNISGDFQLGQVASGSVSLKGEFLQSPGGRLIVDHGFELNLEMSCDFQSDKRLEIRVHIMAPETKNKFHPNLELSGELKAELIGAGVYKVKMPYRLSVDRASGNMDMRGTTSVHKAAEGDDEELPILKDTQITLSYLNKGHHLEVHLVNDTSEDSFTPPFEELKLSVPGFQPASPEKISEVLMELSGVNFGNTGFFDSLRMNINSEAGIMHVVSTVLGMDIPELLDLIANRGAGHDLGESSIEIMADGAIIYSPLLMVESIRSKWQSDSGIDVQGTGVTMDSTELGNVQFHARPVNGDTLDMEVWVRNPSDSMKIRSRSLLLRSIDGSIESINYNIGDSRVDFDDSTSLSSLFLEIPEHRVTGSIEVFGDFTHGLISGAPQEESVNLSLRSRIANIHFPGVPMDIQSMNLDANTRRNLTGGMSNGKWKVQGNCEIESLTWPGLTIEGTRFRIEHKDEAGKGHFAKLESATLLGGTFSSAPVFLEHYPERVNIHLNVEDLDTSQVAALINDFDGKVTGKLNGQVAIKYSPSNIRFQYGSLFLNNPDEARLQWSTKDLLTRGSTGKGIGFKKLKEMEDSIADLNLRRMDVAISSTSGDDSLMKISFDGRPVSGKIKNPVLMSLNFLGNWQTLIDYILHDSGAKLDFSVQ